MKPQRQFRIAHLLAAMVFCSLLMLGVVSPTLYYPSGFFVCFVVAAHCVYHEKSTLIATVCSGIVWANIPLVCCVCWAVGTGYREQGQLYCEDGPVAFFLMSALIGMILSFIGAVTGCVIGYLFQCCVQLPLAKGPADWRR